MPETNVTHLPAQVPGRLHPRREVLENGIVLLWNETHDSPSVAIRGSFPAGAAREPAERAGLAGFTARLLRRGTRRRSALEISEAVEALGASFSVWGGIEEAGFSAKCLARDAVPILEVLREVLEQPAFAPAEVEKVRSEILTQLREQEDSTRARTDLAILRLLYPDGHPYSRTALGARESIEAITPDDLRGFHSAWYSAAGMTVSVAGDVDPARIRRALEGWFPGQPAPPPQPEPPDALASGSTRVRIDMPHKSQVDIIIAGTGIPRRHPDFFPLSMATMILGSLGLMGRLGERVRDQQGLAYHVSARAVSRLWAGEWMAGAGVAPHNVERVIDAILEEVERVRSEPVADEELRDASDYLIGSLPLRLETNDGIAGYMLTCEYYDLGLDYAHRYPEYVRAQTPEALRDAARAHLDPAAASVAMAGPLGDATVAP